MYGDYQKLFNSRAVLKFTQRRGEFFMVKVKKSSFIAIILAVAVAAAMPFSGLNEYWISLIISCFCWSIMALSLNLIVGYLGVRSLGHSAFWGIAAYMLAISVTRLGLGLWVAMGIGLASALILGMIFAAISAHIKGVTYMMTSLALGQVVWGLAHQNSAISGGDNGLWAARVTLFPYSGIPSIIEYYYFTLFVFIVCALIIIVIMRSPLGSTILGIRQSDTRMSILGYDVWKFRFLIIVISAVFSGIAGLMNVQYIKFVSTTDVSAAISAKALLMVLLGGAGTLVGPIIGAFVITLSEHIISAQTERWSMILGLIYILSVFFLKGGLFGLYKDVRKRIGNRKNKDIDGMDGSNSLDDGGEESSV